MKGFTDFVREQGVVGLAVGFMLGGAVTKLVTALINDIINPFLGLMLGFTSNLASQFIQVGQAKVMYGDFINNLVDFIVIALVVYYGVKGLKLDRLDKKKA